MQVIRVLFFGDLRRIPLSPIGDLKNPEGMAGPRAASGDLGVCGPLIKSSKGLKFELNRCHEIDHVDP